MESGLIAPPWQVKTHEQKYRKVSSFWNRCDTKADRKVCRNINKLNANRHMVKLKKLLLDEESVNTK